MYQEHNSMTTNNNGIEKKSLERAVDPSITHDHISLPKLMVGDMPAAMQCIIDTAYVSEV
jgi:hypothetical protein